MSEQFIYTNFKTNCYNCGKNVDQVIKAVPQKAEVVCSNCGATRVFVPRLAETTAKGMFTPIGCYDVWHLTPEASCKNCTVHGPHDLIVGCSHFTTRCRNCGYTRFYKFDLEFIGQCPLPEGEDAGQE